MARFVARRAFQESVLGDGEIKSTHKNRCSDLNTLSLITIVLTTCIYIYICIYTCYIDHI